MIAGSRRASGPRRGPLLALALCLLSATASAQIDGQPVDSRRRFERELCRLVETSPLDLEGGVAVTRETVLRFDRALDPATVNGTTFFADLSGQPLAARVHLSSDRRTVSLYYAEPLPASAQVRVVIDGERLLDRRGERVDVDGDEVAGGIAELRFETLSLTVLEGTAVCGRVFASALSDGGASTPLEGVVVSVDGLEDEVFAVTDAGGNFRLEPAPVGRFFVHVDGKQASTDDPEAYYPSVGKPFVSRALEEVSVPDIFLPRVAPGTLQPVSEIEDTFITFPPEVLAQFPELAGTSVVVPADALYADDGTRGGRVGIAPVASDRLPGPLPADLAFPIVLTLQTDGGSNLDRPVPVTFPNLPDPQTGLPLEPGEKTALWGFNHDTGEWEVHGPMTVTEDGLFVVSDPGTGVLAPGWQGVIPGVQVGARAARFDAVECVKAVVVAGVDCILLFLNVKDFADCLKKGLIDTAAAVIDCVGSDTSGADCVEGLAISGALAVAACGKLAARTFGKVFFLVLDIIDCVASVVDAVQSCLGPGPRDGELLDALDELEHELQRFRDAVEPMLFLFGNEQLFRIDPSEFAQASDWMEVFSTVVQEDGDDGAVITPAELALLLATPAPSNLDATAVDAVVERWNRTQDYWRQGIFTTADVPPGDSTDFVDLGLWRQKCVRSVEAIRSIGADGHAHLADGLVEAFTRTLSSVGAELDELQAPLHVLVRGLDTPVERRVRTTAAGTLRNLPLAAFSRFEVTVLDPRELRIGRTAIATQESGRRLAMIPPLLFASTDIDRDGDGLSDECEDVVGTDPLDPDTDGDGILDAAEVLADTDPLEGTAARTGVIASTDTEGTAVRLDGRDDLVALADGEGGVSLFNVFNGLNPILLRRLPTQGLAQDVAFTGNDRLAVAASDAGLLIVDVSTPAAAEVIHQVSLADAVHRVGAIGDLIFAGAGEHLAVIDANTGALLDQVAIDSIPVEDIVFADGFVYVSSLLRGEQGRFAIRKFPIDALILPSVDFERDHTEFPVFRDLQLAAGNGVIWFAGPDPGPSTNIPSMGVLEDLGGSLELLSSPRPIAAADVVLTGSGLALYTGASTSMAQEDVALLDASDPTVADEVLTVFSTPDRARAVEVFGGLGYVAADDSGMHVLAYQPLDALGQPPTVQLRIDAPNSELEEGRRVLIGAAVQDDVQVRSVELLVDGEVVALDGNFPFEFQRVLPRRSQQATVQLALRATDTGGNVQETAPQVFSLLPDVFGPKVLVAAPAEAAPELPDFGLRGFRVVFDEVVDPAFLDETALSLVSAGPDGVLDTLDDLAVDFAARPLNQGRALLVRPAADLPPGSLRLRLDASRVRDRLGNALDGDGDGIPGGDFDRSVDILPVEQLFWLTDADGDWDEATNWSTGRLPGATDRVEIDVPSQVEVEYAGLDSTIFALECSEHLLLRSTLGLSSTSNVFGRLDVRGVRDGPGTLFTHADLILRGVLREAGSTVALRGFEVTGTSSLENFHVLRNEGLAHVADGVVFGLRSGSRLDNSSIAELDLQGSAVLNRDEGLVQNFGMIRKTGMGTAHIEPRLENLGSILVEQDSLSIEGELETIGTIKVASGATLRLSTGGVLHCGPGSALVGEGQLLLAGGDLRLDEALSFGQVEATSANSEFGGDGRFEITQSLHLQESDFRGRGELVITPGATLDIPGGNTIVDGWRCAVQGSGAWTGGQLRLGSGASLVVESGGELVVDGADSLSELSTGGPAALEVDGVLRKRGPTFNVSVPTTVDGELVVEQGSFFVGAEFVSRGLLELAAGTELHLGTGQHEIGGPVLGDGGIVLSNALGELRLTVPVTLARLDVGSGDLRVDDRVEIGAELIVGRGALSGPGSLVLGVGATGQLSGTPQELDQGFRLEVAGTMTSTASVSMRDAACVHVFAGGTLDLVSGSWGAAGTGERLINDGTLSAGVSSIGAEVLQRGQFEVDGSGRFSLGQFVQTAGLTRFGDDVRADLLDVQGGVVEGSGSFDVVETRLSGGRWSVGGAGVAAELRFDDIASSYEQSGGVLEIELGGLVPGVEHDLVDVRGEATLGGTLELSLIGGFVPSPGDVFTVFEAGSIVGSFASLDAPDLGSGLDWELRVLADRVELEVVAGP